MLSQTEILKIAVLAKFDLTKGELGKLGRLLDGALDYVEVLKELDTSSVGITYEVTGIKNVFADDVVLDSLTQGEAIANAGQSKEGFIVTEAVIKKDLDERA